MNMNLRPANVQIKTSKKILRNKMSYLMHLKFNKTIESRPFNSNEFIEFAKKLNLHSFVYANETIIR